MTTNNVKIAAAEVHKSGIAHARSNWCRGRPCLRSDRFRVVLPIPSLCRSLLEHPFTQITYEVNQRILFIFYIPLHYFCSFFDSPCGRSHFKCL